MPKELPNGYQLSKKWFDFSFENPELIRPIHTAIYFFAIDQCNRLSWTAKFGLPTSMAMLALGIKHHSTYSKALDDLVNWGFIIMIQKSKNQYTANIVALSKNSVATSEALSKATSVAHSEASDRQVQYIKTKKPITKKPITKKKFEMSEFSESIQAILKDWLEHKKHKYTDVGWKSFKTILAKGIDKFGEQLIIDRINQAMAGDWKGPNFDKMESAKVELPTDMPKEALRYMTVQQWQSMDKYEKQAWHGQEIAKEERRQEALNVQK